MKLESVLTSISIKGFKPFKHEAKIDIKPITLFFGENSVGKSSALESLHYINKPIRYNFKNVLNQQVKDRRIAFRLERKVTTLDMPPRVDIKSITTEIIINDDDKKVKIFFDDKPVTLDLLIKPFFDTPIEELFKDKLLNKSLLRDYKNALGEDYLWACGSLFGGRFDHLIEILKECPSNDNFNFLPFEDFGINAEPVLDVATSIMKIEKGIQHFSFKTYCKSEYSKSELKSKIVSNNAYKRLLPISDFYDDYFYGDYFNDKTKLKYRPLLYPSLTLEADEWKKIGWNEDEITQALEDKSNEDEYKLYLEERLHDVIANKYLKRIFEIYNLDAFSSVYLEDQLIDIESLRKIPKCGKRNELKLKDRVWDSLSDKGEHMINTINSNLNTLGLNYILKRYANEDELYMHNDNHEKAHLRDLGTGVSQVIPVLLALQKGSSTIKQPELHLHPKQQLALGDIIAESVVSYKNEERNVRAYQFIETHSEHLLLRLLRRIRETTEGTSPEGAPRLTPEDVAVHYIESTDEGAKVTTLAITDDGDFVDNWPDGFFDERDEELF